MQLANSRILCTEHDDDTRELLCLLLADQGFDVICTEAEDHAIGLAQAESFDLYLLDNRMPDLAGVGLCQKLREFDTRTPILFYSAAAFRVDKERAFSAGAQGYLTKPAENEVLVSEVCGLIAESKSSQTAPALWLARAGLYAAAS